MSEGFLSRWARRKEAVRTAERAADPAPDAAGPGDCPDPAQAARSPEAAVPEAPSPAAEDGEDALAALPSLDVLTAETDLSPFLRAGVPTALRNAALRRMWSLDPAIRDFVSEAREYAYDWNTPGGAPGFGPLLPGDDVKAMLKRLVGSEAPAEAPPQDGTSPEPAEAEAPEAADPDPGAADSVADALPQPGGPDIATMPVEAVPVAEDAVKTPAMRPRLRRHGGAMPA